MKITSDLILSAPTYINPVKEREILLRGHQIPIIENLGITKDLNDSIDLTDNDIKVLGNFPRLVRLRSLLIAQNRIYQIHANVGESLPHLENLNLAYNNLTQLGDLEPLAHFHKLRRLALLGNPVTTRENYRLYVIWRIPSLKSLDYQKVRSAETLQAKTLFGTHETPTALALQHQGSKSRAVLDPSQQEEKRTAILTDEEKEGLRTRLKKATSLVEIEKIEQALKTGVLV